MHYFIKPLIVLIFFFCVSVVQEVEAGIFFKRKTANYPYQLQSRPTRYTTNFIGPVRQWTWPGEISNHLRNHHRINTDGMSFEQMKHLHNVLHESGK